MKQIMGLAVGLLLMSGLFAETQTTISSADIQRLQDRVADAATDIERLRASDPKLASELEPELDWLREEITYLKVKLRREGDVERSEYSDLRDSIDALRTRALGVQEPAAATPPAIEASASPNTVPVGTELDARLQGSLSSETAQVEDRFDATTIVDLSQGSRVVVPAGSVMRGIVTSVDRATRTDRQGSLTVSFDQITVNGRVYLLRGTVTQALESGGVRGEAGRIGTVAGVGAIIGGILGGFKGALAGILIGGGGVNRRDAWTGCRSAARDDLARATGYALDSQLRKAWEVPLAAYAISLIASVAARIVRFTSLVV